MKDTLLYSRLKFLLAYYAYHATPVYHADVDNISERGKVTIFMNHRGLNHTSNYFPTASVLSVGQPRGRS